MSGTSFEEKSRLDSEMVEILNELRRNASELAACDRRIDEIIQGFEKDIAALESAVHDFSKK